MLDWTKLKPYKSDKRKSFEELCYQIAVEECQLKGEFTSLDDSGGGDGVEFYLTLPNGEEWGWQAKFFEGSVRLNIGGRKKQIKDSLQKAIKEHKNLKKWFLCTNSNFTTGEVDWFKNILPKSKKNGKSIVPENSDIKLIHWGESEINIFLLI